MSGNDQPVDDAAAEPEQRSAVDSAADRRRESRKQLAERRQREWFDKAISSDPHFRQFCWNILAASGVFEKRYGFGPNGHPNPEGTQFFDGQRELGMRLYHSWSVLSRAGVLSLLDEFHPGFPKRKGK